MNQHRVTWIWGILAVTLTSYMTLAKPPTSNNTPAYTKRWKAALASVNIVDRVPITAWAGVVELSTLFCNIVAGRPDLRSEIVRRVITITKKGAENAVLSQIKLVWEYSALKGVLFMDAFIKSHCRVLEIPAVLDQAIELKEKWEHAKTSDPNLAYSRVMDPNARSELNHSRFPDLYYAAVSYARLNKLMGDNFLISKGHTSSYVHLIEKYLSKSAQAELGEMSETVKEKLTKLGYPVTRRRRREEDDKDEEAVNFYNTE